MKLAVLVKSFYMHASMCFCGKRTISLVSKKVIIHTQICPKFYRYEMDRDQLVKNEEIENLEEKHEKQIEKITLENKIALLELQKENQALKRDI